MRSFTAVAGCAIGLLVLAGPAAALTTFNLIGTVGNGEFAGTVGTGTVTFDETKLVMPPVDDVAGPVPNGVIIEGPPPDVFPILMVPDFSLSFSIFDQEFTEANDIDFPEFPTLAFGVLPIGPPPDVTITETQGVVEGGFEFVPLFLDFFVTEQTFSDDQVATEIIQPGVFNIGFGPLLNEGLPDLNPLSIATTQETPTFTSTIIVNNVPLPAGFALMLTVIAIGAGLARARSVRA